MYMNSKYTTKYYPEQVYDAYTFDELLSTTSKIALSALQYKQYMLKHNKV